MSTKATPPKAGRPVRPSVAREREKEEAARTAAKLERTSVRLVVETSSAVLRELRICAALEGITVRAFVLRAIADQGVKAARMDAEGK